MATDINQYKNAPIYGSPKKVGTAPTFRGDVPIEYNNKAKGKTASECQPIDDYNSKGTGKTTDEQPI